MFYFVTHTRVPPWLIGLIFGAFLLDYQANKERYQIRNKVKRSGSEQNDKHLQIKYVLVDCYGHVGGSMRNDSLSLLLPRRS